jgi:ribosomal protein S27E
MVLGEAQRSKNTTGGASAYMMYVTGAPCPKCGKDSFFPLTSIPNTLNMKFRCAKCGHIQTIIGSYELEVRDDPTLEIGE